MIPVMAIAQHHMPNGTHDPMSLTLYSANPDQDSEKTPASTSIPPEYLLPNGHPDVCVPFIRPSSMTNDGKVPSAYLSFPGL